VPLRIETNRLDLVAATEGIVHAELEDRVAFASLLGAEVPDDWPPPLNDESSMRWVLDVMRTTPAIDGWITWYFLLRRPDAAPLAVGNGGFKGVPAADGTVEIGYSIRVENQRQGFASEAVDALVEWAFSHAFVTRVIAHTLPVLAPSIRVLEKNGFVFPGDGEEEGTIVFERRRPD
jgi:RimJ/RimL family protein N-acetyltransferase